METIENNYSEKLNELNFGYALNLSEYVLNNKRKVILLQEYEKELLEIITQDPSQISEFLVGLKALKPLISNKKIIEIKRNVLTEVINKKLGELNNLRNKYLGDKYFISCIRLNESVERLTRFYDEEKVIYSKNIDNSILLLIFRIIDIIDETNKLLPYPNYLIVEEYLKFNLEKIDFLLDGTVHITCLEQLQEYVTEFDLKLKKTEEPEQIINEFLDVVSVFILKNYASRNKLLAILGKIIEEKKIKEIDPSLEDLEELVAAKLIR